MTSRRQAAMDFFTKGYNCAQAVLLSFSDKISLSTEEIERIAMPFGGGISRLRSVCGAVSGMIMAYGVICGDSGVLNNDIRTEHYENVQALVSRFSEKNGSYICGELIKGFNPTNNPRPDIRNEEYYKRRPCKELVGDATEILEKFLQSESDNN